VGILVAVVRRESHLHEKVIDPLGDSQHLHRLRNDVAHPPARIEARVGVLEDHLHAPAMELDPALGRRIKTHDQAGDGGLAAA
jgi:hypothetical protein